MLWNERRKAISAEIKFGVPELLLRSRLLEIVLGNDARDSLKAIELLMALGVKSVVESELSDDERTNAYRILGGLLRAAAPEISDLIRSWADGSLAADETDDHGEGGDGLEAFRFVGQSELPLGGAQHGDSEWSDSYYGREDS